MKYLISFLLIIVLISMISKRAAQVIKFAIASIIFCYGWTTTKFSEIKILNTVRKFIFVFYLMGGGVTTEHMLRFHGFKIETKVFGLIFALGSAVTDALYDMKNPQQI